MIPQSTIDAINRVRDAFLTAVRTLPDVPSFATLRQSSPELGGEFQRLASIASRRHVAEPCTGRLTVAIVGSSGHGKTTILDEMFPALSARGWLETDVTDTTSQALALEYAPPGDPIAAAATVRSWSISQVKELMNHADVRDQNARDGIEVAYHDDLVAVDGTHATLDAKDLAAWRYPRRVELRPFAEPFEVPPERAADRKFIRALTVKEQSSVLDPAPVLQHAGHSYDALQLRAVVESVTLRDDFEQVLQWAGADADQARKLTFVDTPGLAVSSVAKDEVLRHYLGRKSHQLALDLLRDDRLDIVVHLVLCGQKSQFDTLWREIERACGRAEAEALAERIVLAINGMNVYLTNPDVRAKYTDRATMLREGDHFAATLEDNVLQRMSPRGNLRPARIAFLDSRRIVDAFADYAEFYSRHRRTMETWTEPGGPGHQTLARHGLVESFRENIDAIADPSDRGQGFLVRQVLGLAADKGATILARKHLVRTGLLQATGELHALLGRFYDSQGALNTDAVRAALSQCLGFLDATDPLAIDRFATREIDRFVDGLIPSEDETARDDWAAEAFLRLGEMVKEAIIEANGSRVPGAVWHEFSRFFDDRIESWTERWGYRAVDWPPPPDAAVGTRELLGHCLRLHARELLFQLMSAEDLGADSGAVIAQSEADRETIAELLRQLEDATATGVRTCAQAAVPTHAVPGNQGATR
ncbi:MAG: hypothetical protein IPM29_03655 [Planctomycetes bacterium]|nr:hypothetical protein [Planctomycetota bacterium]